MIDPWPRLLRVAAELPLDTTEAAIAALAPSSTDALDALRALHSGRRTLADVLRQFGVSKSEAQNRGKVLLYLSRDLGLLSEVSPGRYRASTLGGAVSASGGASVVRRGAPPARAARRIRRPADVAAPVMATTGPRVVQIDLDVNAERTVEHQRIVRECATVYLARGCEVYEGNYDLLVLCPDGSAVLIEAKTITNLSERAQLKLGVGQLSCYEVDDARAMIANRPLTKVIATNGALSTRGKRLLDALGIEHQSY